MLKLLVILALAALIVVSGCTSPHPLPPTAGGNQLQASEDFLDSQSNALIDQGQGTEQDLLALP